MVMAIEPIEALTKIIAQKYNLWLTSRSFDKQREHGFILVSLMLNLIIYNVSNRPEKIKIDKIREWNTQLNEIKIKTSLLTQLGRRNYKIGLNRINSLQNSLISELTIVLYDLEYFVDVWAEELIAGKGPSGSTIAYRKKGKDKMTLEEKESLLRREEEYEE